MKISTIESNFADLKVGEFFVMRHDWDWYTKCLVPKKDIKNNKLLRWICGCRKLSESNYETIPTLLLVDNRKNKNTVITKDKGITYGGCLVYKMT